MLLENIHQYFRPSVGGIETDVNIYHQHILSFALNGNSNKKIAFYGQPDQRTMDIFKNAGYSFLDLDIDFKHPKEKIVPEVYCHIIRDIINNAIYLRDEIEYVVCTTGQDKCDQGRNVRDLLSEMDFKVIDGSNLNPTPLRKPIISQSRGPLKHRVIRIMELIYNPLTLDEEQHYLENQCEPSFNFHGVPPQDIDLLSLFPEDTHIQGWTRLVEMGIPSRVDLEWKVTNDMPTIYFSQSFCNKQLMAEYLSNKNNGLYIDGHGAVTGSIRAKLEAFLRLRRNNSNNLSQYKDSIRV